MKTDYHVHSCFSDGKHTPEEIILAAIAKKIDVLGFSDHSYTWFDADVCRNMEDTSEYVKQIRSLAQKYKDKITVLCGIEQDYYSLPPAEKYDFIIGSEHYLRVGNEYFAVDGNPEIIKKMTDKYFGGDIMSVCEKYFEKVAQIKDKTGADIVGHFDIISKHNENGDLFDSKHPRYVAAWKKAADKLLKQNVLFEINTGAISRGYRVTPYPSDDIIKYLDEHGGRFIFSSDSHDKNTLAFKFDLLLEKANKLKIDVVEIL